MTIEQRKVEEQKETIAAMDRELKKMQSIAEMLRAENERLRHKINYLRNSLP